MMGPVWDFDIAWHNADYCEAFNPEGWAYKFGNYCPWDYWQVPFWWNRLLTDTSFINPLKCRWEALRMTTLSEDSLFATVDSLVENVYEAQERNFEQWPIIGIYVWPNPWPVAQSYEEEIEDLKIWINQRLVWLDSNMPGICNSSGFGWEQPRKTPSFVFPNPFHDRLKIQLPGEKALITEVEMFNNLGKRAEISWSGSNSGEISVMTGDLPSGIYLVKISTAHGYLVNKIVKR